MTRENIDVMDIIVSKMAEGDKLSKALEHVYTKRSVMIHYNDKQFDVPITNIGLSRTAIRRLIRTKLMTLGDLVEFCNANKITDIVNMGKGTGIEVFETVLDYCWSQMTAKEKELFLIDTVERNSEHIRAEIV